MLKLSPKQKEAVVARFSENALKMMNKRYLVVDEEGNQETPADMFARVAGALAKVEEHYGKTAEDIEKIEHDFYEIMARKEYTPAGRTMRNAGADTSLVANCIVLPIHDSMESIFQTLKEAALLQQAGSGLGFDLSEMRPAMWPTKKSQGHASGPVSFLRVYDAAFGTIKQQCFAKGTRIVTKRGLIPIEEVRKGDETFTEKGWKKVTEVFFNGKRETLKLTFDSGFEIELTPNHKVAVIRGKKIALKQVKDLSEEDVLLMKLGDGTHTNDKLQKLERVISSPRARAIRQPEVLDESLAYFLGLYFADGNNDSQGVRVAIHDADSEEDNFRSLVGTLFGISPFLEKSYDGCRKFHVSSQTLKRFLQKNGFLKQYAWEIEVPEKVLRSSRSVQRAFIAGFFDGDGDNGKNYRLNTSSKAFAQQLQFMLLANGIGAKIKEEQRRANWRVVYRVGIIGRNSTHKFYEELSQHSWKIQKKEETKDFGWIFPFNPVEDLGYSWDDIRGLHDGIRSTISRSALSQIQARTLLQQVNALVQQKVDWTGFLPVRIKKIESAGKQEVYDFEVEDIHMINAGLYTSNSRHGANMAMMRVDHPDVLDFINCKKMEGEIRNFNISVTMTDEFMKQLEEAPDTQWFSTYKGQKMKPHNVLRHPNGSVYGAEEANITVKELFDHLVEGAWTNGEPGIAFIDTVNKTNPLPGLGPIAVSNPCVTGDTLVPTDRGFLKMEDLVGQYGNGGLRIAIDQRVPATLRLSFEKEAVLAGAKQERISFFRLLSSPEHHTNGEVEKAWKTGRKPVYRLTTRSGYELNLTKNHKVFTPEGKVPLEKLKKGDAILLQSQEGLWSNQSQLPFVPENVVKGRNGRVYSYNFPSQWSKELGQVLGWLVGDGWLRDKPKEYMTGFTFAEEDLSVLSHLRTILNDWYHNSAAKERRRENGVYHLMYNSKSFVEYFKKLGVKPVHAAEKEVPEALWCAPREAVAGFLQALFSADGTINIVEKNQTRYIRLTSKSEKLLKQVQVLLLNFGIRSSIYDRSRKPSHKMGYQNDGVCFELQITRTNIPRFLEKVGFFGAHYNKKVATLQQVTNGKRGGYYREDFEDEIKDISYAGERTVYDLTEPFSHSFIANGIVVSNCGEQFLHPYDNCNLGSINLAVFVRDGQVDWERLRFATRTAVRLMDDVIDKFDFPVEKVTELALKNRRIGLGIMGFADMLYQLNIRYDSPEGVAMAEKVMGFINTESHKMSQKLAEEKGVFPNYDKSIFAERGVKMRNAALTTVAPTGSIAMMFDTSSGIEPNFALAYIKQDKDGFRYRYFNQHFQKALDGLNLPEEDQKRIMDEVIEKGSIQHLADLPEELRNTFVVAMDISGRDHMQMQAAFQRNVDNSISKTINFKNEATREDIGSSFISAWKLGCKAATVYRDGSRTIQILNVGKGDKIVAPTEKPSAREQEEEPTAQEAHTRPAVRPRPDIMTGKTYKMKTGYGSLYITINNDEKGEPFEVFATIGKSGGFFQEQTEAITRLISLSLRAGIDIKEVVGNLEGIRGPMPIFTDKGTVLSLPDAIGKVIKEHVGSVREVEEALQRPEHQEVLAFAKEEKQRSMADFGFMPGCPECGNALTMQEGCISCHSCGFSRCS